MTTGLRHLDLFAGIGGFSLGLERTGGFETVAFCEIEQFQQKVLRKHWPDVPIFDDVKELKGEDVGQVDIITGGFPCQDLSVAGKRQGIEGERSGLWSEIIRLACEIRPKYLLVENVANMLAGPSELPGRWFGRVLGDLASIGYDAEWNCIPASAVGAPHRRDRVWIVAYPSQKRCGEKGELLDRPTQRLTRSDETGLSSDFNKERAQRCSPGQVPRFPEFSWCEDCRSVEDIIRRADLYTPALCGNDNGVPDRVDRTGSLGNAILPQLATIHGLLIMKDASIHGLSNSNPL